MAPTRRQSQSAAAKISKSPGNITSPSPKAVIEKKSQSTYRIPKKSAALLPKKSDALLPPPFLGTSQNCLNIQMLCNQEEEYVPEPICHNLPSPVAYEPKPVVARPSSPSIPVTRARSSRSTLNSKAPPTPAIKKGRPPTPVASKVPATPTAATEEEILPPVVAIPNPVKSILKKKSKYSPETEKLPLEVEEPKGEILETKTPSRSKDETPDTIKKEKKKNKVQSSSSSISVSQKKPPSTPPSANSQPQEIPTTIKIPRLFNLCERQILQEAYETQIYDCSSDVHVPFSLLRPLLEKYSTDSLFETEITMPWLESGIESIWRKRLARDFPSSRLYPLETYGEAYRRCLVEREDIP